MPYRLVRNIALEKYYFGSAQPFAPLYDVEELDANRMPARVIATGGAAWCRKVIERAERGEELPE
jgi:hypothetical protein